MNGCFFLKGTQENLRRKYTLVTGKKKNKHLYKMVENSPQSGNFQNIGDNISVFKITIMDTC